MGSRRRRADCILRPCGKQKIRNRPPFSSCCDAAQRPKVPHHAVKFWQHGQRDSKTAKVLANKCLCLEPHLDQTADRQTDQRQTEQRGRENSNQKACLHAKCAQSLARSHHSDVLGPGRKRRKKEKKEEKKERPRQSYLPPSVHHELSGHIAAIDVETRAGCIQRALVRSCVRTLACTACCTCKPQVISSTHIRVEKQTQLHLQCDFYCLLQLQATGHLNLCISGSENKAMCTTCAGPDQQPAM